jgi:hypothetical protein
MGIEMKTMKTQTLPAELVASSPFSDWQRTVQW